MARLLGIYPQQVDTFREVFGHKHELIESRRVWLHAPDWLKLWASRTGASSGGKSAFDDPDTEPEAGATPELERLRRIKADREEIKLREDCKELIPVAEINRLWELVGTCIRNASESMTPNCKQQLQEALDEAEAEISSLYGGDGGREPAT